jgi:hypothetical protein
MTLEAVEVAMNELHHSRYCGALLARPLYAESAKLCVLTSGRRYSTVSREMDVSTVSLGAQTILTRSLSPSSRPMELPAR